MKSTNPSPRQFSRVTSDRPAWPRPQTTDARPAPRQSTSPTDADRAAEDPERWDGLS